MAGSSHPRIACAMTFNAFVLTGIRMSGKARSLRNSTRSILWGALHLTSSQAHEHCHASCHLNKTRLHTLFWSHVTSSWISFVRR